MRVLIVGGGPAGAIAARELARAGLETVLIERSPDGCKPCGGGVPLTAFAELDIPTAVIERKVTTIRLLSPRGASAEIPLGTTPVAMVRRSVFDAALREMAREAGAEIRTGNVVRAWLGAKPGVTIWEGRGRTSDLAGDVLLAADGANSVVARSLGFPLERTAFGIQEWFDLAPSLVSRYASCCEFHYRGDISPDFYGWVFPKGETVSVGTGATCGKAGRLPALLTSLKKRVGPELEILRPIRREVFPIPIGGRRPSLSAGPVLFLGDAAGLVMPTSGEGIYYAMKSGEIAARAVRENASRPARIGKAYAREWEKGYGRRYAVMARLQAFFYQSDERREKLVSIHHIKEIQDVSRSLWLDRHLTARMLLSYSRLLFRVLKVEVRS